MRDILYPGTANQIKLFREIFVLLNKNLAVALRSQVLAFRVHQMQIIANRIPSDYIRLRCRRREYLVRCTESHVDRSIENPEIFLITNILGTQILMDACKKFGVKRYHQVSTDEVYGDLPLERLDLFFNEKTPIRASSPYSASKAAADLLVLSYYRTYALPVSISRCSNNYGPFHFPEKLIPLIIRKAMRDEKLPVYGNGENIRDWLYVEDHCVAIDLIVRKGRIGEVYNIGGHNERTNLEVVKTILRILNKPESLISFVKDRPGHDLRYAIDATKIENELGWKANHDFDSGIIETIRWNLKNEKWLKDIESGEYLKWMERYIEK